MTADNDAKPASGDHSVPEARDDVRPASREPRGRGRLADLGNSLMRPTRLLVVVPCIGLLIGSVSLIVATFASAIQITAGALMGTIDRQTMLVGYIENADYFLLSVVLYIMSVGLYSLFVDGTVEMPFWLEIRNLDDLKEKLVGVIVVVMGVYFLGQLIHGTGTGDLLRMGLGIGAVALSLTYFVKNVITGRR